MDDDVIRYEIMVRFFHHDVVCLLLSAVLQTNESEEFRFVQFGTRRVFGRELDWNIEKPVEIRRIHCFKAGDSAMASFTKSNQVIWIAVRRFTRLVDVDVVNTQHVPRGAFIAHTAVIAISLEN
jgi:hypothetical protein